MSTTLRRHALYGTEDKVVIDPGSHTFKIGFSGESRPRACVPTALPLPSGSSTGTRANVGAAGSTNVFEGLWGLDVGMGDDGEEKKRVVEGELGLMLREVFYKRLQVDPKARKVLILENPYLPLYVKEMLCRILFQNFQVPSISFIPIHHTSLLATGRTSALVVDVGFLESVVLPISSSRPMFSHLLSSPHPSASHLLNILRKILIRYAQFVPADITSSTNASRAEPLPLEALTKSVVEDIMGRCLLVQRKKPSLPLDEKAETPIAGSGMSVISEATETIQLAVPSSSSSATFPSEEDEDDHYLTLLHKMYSTLPPEASDIVFRLPVSLSSGFQAGSLVIPGWVRSHTTDFFWHHHYTSDPSLSSHYSESESLPHLILKSIKHLPRDLKKSMCSSILVTGGVAQLPGFVTRLRQELVHLLSSPPKQAPITVPMTGRKRVTHIRDEWREIRQLQGEIGILNDPSGGEVRRGGEAPAWGEGMIGWVGGSLAGTLKLSAPEITKEFYDNLSNQITTQALAVTAQPPLSPSAAASPPSSMDVDAPRLEPAAAEDDEMEMVVDEEYRRARLSQALGDWMYTSLRSIIHVQQQQQQQVAGNA